MKKVVQFILDKEEAVYLLNAAAAAIITAKIKPVMIANPEDSPALLTSWALLLDVQQRMTIAQRDALVDRLNATMKAAFGDELVALDPT